LTFKKMLMCLIILVCSITLVSCKDTNMQLKPAEIHLLIPSPNDSVPDKLIINKIYTALASSFEQVNPQIKVIVDQGVLFSYERRISIRG
jgi:hypothetical protein